METTITTEYSYGQQTWIWKLGKPIQSKIDKVSCLFDSIGMEVKYHLQCDDGDYWRYEEELFPTKKELMDAMNVKTVKIGSEEVMADYVLECMYDFVSAEKDIYYKGKCYLVVKVNHNSIIVNGRKKWQKIECNLLYREEVANYFKIFSTNPLKPIIDNNMKIGTPEHGYIIG